MKKNKQDEPELQDNDLRERIHTQLNRYGIASELILWMDKEPEHAEVYRDWLNTVLEDAFTGAQWIIDEHCVKRD